MVNVKTPVDVCGDEMRLGAARTLTRIDRVVNWRS